MSDDVKNTILQIENGEDAVVLVHGVGVGKLKFDADRGSYDFYQRKKLTDQYASNYALESEPSDCETGSVLEAAAWVAGIIEDATFYRYDIFGNFENSLSLADFEGYDENNPAIEIY